MVYNTFNSGNWKKQLRGRSAGKMRREGRPARGRSGALVRAAGRGRAIVDFERALVDFFIGASDVLGVPKSVAAIYAVCFASAEPLSFSEIHQRLDVSAGSISQGLRLLREVGALRVAHDMTRVPLHKLARESRSRERFEPDLGLRKLIAHFIEQRLDHLLETAEAALSKISKQVPASSVDASKLLGARIATLQNWHQQARELLPVIKSFLKLN